jgi:uncharacterized protein YdbL (DUF1318 family)
MNMIRMATWIVMACIAVGTTAFADALSDAKERRKVRQDSIQQIVKAGDAKEGDQGYLEPKAGIASDKAALIKAENADRKVGYESIAKANGKNVEAIGKKAAEITRKRAAGEK